VFLEEASDCFHVCRNVAQGFSGLWIGRGLCLFTTFDGQRAQPI